MVRIKRAYEAPTTQDGDRVLVDGLWPRGLTREKLRVSEWMRDLAPSKDLRNWYKHDPEKWTEFRRRYRQELSAPPQKSIMEALIEKARKGTLTLVFGARNAEHSNAAVLAEVIRKKLRKCERPLPIGTRKL